MIISQYIFSFSYNFFTLCQENYLRFAKRGNALLKFQLFKIIMLNFIGYVFYGIAIADFLGMFFGYDFTGQVWTPYLFGAIGAGCQSLGKN